MATLALAANEMVDRIEERMGWPTPTATQSAWGLKRLNDGYKRFRKGRVPGTDPAEYHDWLFLRPYATVTLWKTATGAASGAPVKDNGTSIVTSAEAMFYASMVGHSVAFTTGGNSYVIASYTSATVVVVTGDASGEADADVLTVTADGRYSIPSDFSGIIEPPVFAYVSDVPGDLTQTSLNRLYTFMRDDNTADDPLEWSLEPKTHSSSAVQAWWFRTFPTPADNWAVILCYRRSADALTDAAVYTVAGIDHDETVLQFAFAEAEKWKFHKNGPEEAMAQERMLESIALDRALFANSGQIEQMTDVDTGLRVWS